MLASGSAIAARYRSFSGREEHVTAEEVTAAAERGDPHAVRAIDDAARSLGAGVANVINLLNPDLMVLAGGVARLGDEYLDTVRREAGARSFREAFEHATIEPARGGYEVGALGAAHLAREA